MVEFLSAIVGLHCGRVQLRRKIIKEINISKVFARRQLKRSFSDDIVTVRLSCDPDDLRGGLRIEGAVTSGFIYSFTQHDIIPYGVIDAIYISSTDFREELEKMAEWPKYFQLLTADTLVNDSIDNVQTFIIVTKDISCYLFFLNEKRGSLQTSIRKILQTLFNNKSLQFSKASSIAGIQFLDQRNLNDASLLCPFNNQGEWAAEVSSCMATCDFQNNNSGYSRPFELDFRRNPTWAGHLSQYYVVPKLLPTTVWLYTHSNGSILISGSQSLPETEIFDLESFLWEPMVPHQVFMDLAHQVASDHYKDWLGSSTVFWGAEGEFAAKWLNLVSNTLHVTSLVVKAVISREFHAVLLKTARRSLCLVVAALAQLCLSLNSRSSVKSVNRLIQKYFVSLGFTFRLCNNQPHYLFILFLDCFYQLVCQNRMEFGITAEYLKAIAVAFVSEYFFEFSFSSPSERVDACRRDNRSRHRWFFPIEQNFNIATFRSFVNKFYLPEKVAKKFAISQDPAVPIDPPISYYPFNLAAEKVKQDNQVTRFVRSQSEGDLADEDDRVSVSSKLSRNRFSFGFRMSRLFQQRSPHPTLIIYKPLALRRAVTGQSFASPCAYFCRKERKTQVIIPRYQQPFLRFWNDFILAHEYDFDSLDSFEESPLGGVEG